MVPDTLDHVFATAIEIADDKIKKSPATDVVCRNCPYNHTCCDSLVGLTLIEALILAKHINARPDKFRIIRRMRERYELIKKAYHKITKLPDGDLVAEYFSKHVKCALYQDGKCSVYDTRPIVCREAYTDPGNSCYETSTAADTRVQEYLIGIAQRMGVDDKHLGFVEMNTGVLQILTNKPLRDYFGEALVAKVKRDRERNVSPYRVK